MVALENIVVVFDLFETIIHNNMFDFNLALQYLYKDVLMEGTDQVEFINYTETYWKRRFDERDIDNTEICFEEELLDFKYKYGFKVDMSIKEIAYNCLEVMNDVEIFSDTIETLENLNKIGVPVYLLSNAIFKKDTMVKFINRFELEKYFVNSYFSADYAIRKPHQDFFNVVYKDIVKHNPSIEKKDIYFVGDNPIADIEGSRKFGFTPIHIKRNDKSCAVGGIIEINSLSEVIEVLNKKKAGAVL